MSRSHLLSTSFKIAAFALGALLPGQALAVQPLEQFFDSARVRSFDAREQRATSEQRDWERGAALGRLLPSFSATGIYQRNQYEVAVQLPGSTQRLVISPYNQFDAFLQVDIPLVDLANYYRYDQAKHLAKAAELQKELVGTDLDRAVAGSYYSYVGASALCESAEQSLGMAQENAELVATRREVGVSTELDLERARANVERARQDLADAELIRSIAARNLETLSGITPTPVTEYPEDDLRTEVPLQTWLDSRDTPSDRVQARLSEASAAGKRAARAALLPTLSINGQERFTNATGFAGRSSMYTLQAVLSWRLDYGTYATAQAQAAADELQQIRSERARRGVEDTIFDAYKRVEAGIVKSTAARAQAAAARKAAELALDRYRAGALTQLDVTQSQRDLFQAQTARIQADADLSLARVILRVVAGKPPTEDLRAAPRDPLPARRPSDDAATPSSAPSPSAPSPDAAPPGPRVPPADPSRGPAPPPSPPGTGTPADL